MLVFKRSPAPPWLPIPSFSRTGTVVFSGLIAPNFVAVLALVDRSFELVSATAWTPLGDFGLRMSTARTAIPNGAEWWALAINPVGDLELPRAPHDVFRVLWELCL